MPQTVKEIGEKYKEKWSAADGSRLRVDSLKEQAAQELYTKAKKRVLEIQDEYGKKKKWW